MASVYSTSASGGSGRGSGDSSSDAQQTLSATLSTPSMPDIFVWAPEDDRSLRNSNPQCAFDSADPYFDFGLHQDPPPKPQPSDQHEETEEMIQELDYDEEDNESIYEEVQEDFDHVQVVPRKSGFQDDEQELVFTRQVILQQSPPPPPSPEKSKNLKSRAASFLRSLSRSSKKNTSGLNLAETQPSRRATSQDLPSSDRDTIRSKRSVLFNFARRNKSTTALSRVSTTESDLSLDPDPFSSTPPVPPVPVEYESQVRKPILRRQETEPSSLRNRAIQKPSAPLPPLPSVHSPPFNPFSQSSPPTTDYFPSRNPSNSLSERPMPSLVTPPPRGSSHVKLPSLHFDSLQFDLASF